MYVTRTLWNSVYEVFWDNYSAKNNHLKRLFTLTKTSSSSQGQKQFDSNTKREYVWSPGGSDGKGTAYNVGNPDSIPGLWRSSGEGNGNPLQDSCLGNPMDGGAW